MRDTQTNPGKYLKSYIFVIKSIALFASVCFLTGCLFIPKEEEVLAPPLKEPPKIEYSTLELKKGIIEKSISCTGYFVSVEQKDLSFKNRSGRLKAIHTKIGKKVKKGELLAELQTDSLETQIKRQEITLGKLQLNYELIKSNGQRDIDLSQMKLTKLKKQLEKMNHLEGVYSLEQLEEMKTQILEAEVIHDSAKTNYETNLKVVERDLQACKLELDDLNDQLDNAKIFSPIDGTVDYIADVKEGDFVEAYKNIVRVANPNELQIGYSEDKVGNFEIGMKVELRSEDNHFKGTVVMTPSNMPSDADEKTKKSIRIEADKLPEDASISDFVEIKLILDRKENVIVIPKSSLHTLGERRYVHILENGLKIERDVEIGIETQTEVEIVKGLSIGDKVIRE